MAAWRPQNRLITKIKKSSGRIAKGIILTPSFIEIAPAVTKGALLTDDDGRHVIAIAHQRWAKKGDITHKWKDIKTNGTTLSLSQYLSKEYQCYGVPIEL
jgi:hypothetical protein